MTYSKLFGYKKCIDFVFVLTWLDIFTNIVLVWNLNKISVAALLANTVWGSMKFFEYKKDPGNKVQNSKQGGKVYIYTGKYDDCNYYNLFDSWKNIERSNV